MHRTRIKQTAQPSRARNLGRRKSSVPRLLPIPLRSFTRHVIWYAHNLHHQKRSHQTAQSQASRRRGSPRDRGPGAGLASPIGGQAQKRRSAPRWLVLRAIKSFVSPALPPKCVIRNAFAIGACVESLAGSRIPSSLSSMQMECAGHTTSYGGKTRIGVAFIPTLRPPLRPVNLPLCTLALSRFAFST